MSEIELIRQKAAGMTRPQIVAELHRIDDAIAAAARPREVKRYQQRAQIFQAELDAHNARNKAAESVATESKTDSSAVHSPAIPPIEDRRKERAPMFHLEFHGYGLMLHTNLCGPQVSYVQRDNASRFPCLHELQSAMRKHDVPPGVKIISE